MCLLMYMIIMMYVIGICMHILLIGLREYVDTYMAWIIKTIDVNHGQ